MLIVLLFMPLSMFEIFIFLKNEERKEKPFEAPLPLSGLAGGVAELLWSLGQPPC